MPEPELTLKEGSVDGEKKRRRKKKKHIYKGSISGFSKTKTHLRYLLCRIKHEQNLIDAYSAEGWKRPRFVCSGNCNIYLKWICCLSLPITFICDGIYRS